MNKKIHIKESLKKSFGIFIISFLMVTITTFSLYVFRNSLEKAHIGLFFLLLVVMVGAVSGTKPALLTAVLSFLSWNFFFFEPYYTFRINAQRDWILLSLFLLIAIIVGQITGRLKKRESEAIEREKETSALYESSLSIQKGASLEKVLLSLTSEIMTNIPAKAAAVFEIDKSGDGYKDRIIAGSGNMEILESEERLEIRKRIYREDTSIEPPHYSSFKEDAGFVLSKAGKASKGIVNIREKDDIVLLLKSEKECFGELFIHLEPEKQLTNYHYRFIIMISIIITTAIERFQLLEERSRASALQDSEHLKSVLFSSISHNLKNPLVSLNATLSSLSEADIDWKNPKVIEDHLSLMSEDLDRLTENIDNLLNLAKLETGMWKPKFDRYDLQEVIGVALGQLSDRDYSRIVLQIPDEFMLVWVDISQISQVIRHLVENALKYSPAASPVTIGAKMFNTEVKIWVDDRGKGVSPQETKGIFDKLISISDLKGKTNFERGTGLGLTICKEIMNAHNGSIEVDRSPGGGARFTAVLPLKDR